MSDKETPVKHTQTEWRLVLESKHEDENGDTWMEIQTPDGGVIAKVNLYPPMPHVAGFWYQTGIANGRLIAAAPDHAVAVEAAAMVLQIGVAGDLCRAALARTSPNQGAEK